MWKDKGKFTAISDDGRRYTVYIQVKILDAGNFEDHNATVEGLVRYRTADGSSVN